MYYHNTKKKIKGLKDRKNYLSLYVCFTQKTGTDFLEIFC